MFLKLLWIGIAIIFLILIGTAGYMVIEKWCFLDALYMTVISLTTVGFGEVHPLSPAGRLYTVLLLVFGIATVGYLVGNAFEGLVEVGLKRILGRSSVEKKIKALKNHLILCGYGRLGQAVAQHLKGAGIPIVVLENDPSLAEDLEKEGLLYIICDAISEESLQRAGIERARWLISTLNNDAGNVFITMAAKALNPNIFVIASYTDERSYNHLIRAGADRIVSPYLTGGERIAHLVLKPNVLDYIELATKGGELQLESVVVGENAPISGKTILSLDIRRRYNVVVVAIRRAGEDEMILNPHPETTINAGDLLIVAGKQEHLTNFRRTLLGEVSPATS